MKTRVIKYFNTSQLSYMFRVECWTPRVFSRGKGWVFETESKFESDALRCAEMLSTGLPPAVIAEFGAE